MIFVLAYFIIELLASIKFGISIGFGLSALWVIATSLIGATLLRLSPYAIMGSFNHIGFKKFNIKSAQNAAISYVIGAIMLIIPGIFSDFLGLFLLLYTIYLRLFAKMPTEQKNFKNKGDDDVIDVEIIDTSSSDNTSIKRWV